MARLYFGLVLGGVFIPLIFQTIWWFNYRYQAINLNLKIGIQKLMLILWPSSLMLLPTGSDESLLPVALLISIVMNVLVYIIIGSAIWYGIRKNYIVLIPIAIVIIFIWWRVLTL